MATGATLVPLSEYLSTAYRPDRDFLEGELLERNRGEQPHARMQNFLSYLFRLRRDAWGVRSLPEQRLQVRPERFRVPDLVVTRMADPDDLVIAAAPLICIEILSSSDSLTSIQQRVDDYLQMGVPNVWIIDPWNRIAYYATARGFTQPEDGDLHVAGTPIRVSLAELFAELD